MTGTVTGLDFGICPTSQLNAGDGHDFQRQRTGAIAGLSSYPALEREGPEPQREQIDSDDKQWIAGDSSE